MWRSRSLVRALAAGLGLAFAAPAYADPVDFTGSRPKEEHVHLRLNREQKVMVAAAPETRYAGIRSKRVVISLDTTQQEAVRAVTGKRLTWVDALTRAYLELDCDCYSANAAVLGFDEISVLSSSIDEVAISPAELQRARGLFVDESIAAPEEPPPSETSACMESIETKSGVAWRDAAKVAFVTLAAHAFRVELRSRLPALMDLIQAAPWPGDGMAALLPNGWTRASVKGRLLQEPYWTWQFAQPGESVVDGWMMHASEFKLGPTRSGRMLAWPETALKRGAGAGGEGKRLSIFFPGVNAEASVVHPYWIAASFRDDHLEAAVEFPVARAGALSGRGRTINLSLFAPTGALFVSVFPDDDAIRLEMRECGVTVAER